MLKSPLLAVVLFQESIAVIVEAWLREEYHWIWGFSGLVTSSRLAEVTSSRLAEAQNKSQKQNKTHQEFKKKKKKEVLLLY